FSLSIAEELRPKGTRVTVVCPSLVSTPMMDAISGCEGVGPTFAVRRPLTPEEVARAVVERGIDRGELEVVLSAPGSFQGPLAKLANAFPRTNAWGMPLIEARGERRRRALAQSGAE
ncbi:MAG: SDR family oxidoreductase, partial [Deltaproteobacteria bacterium]|nr:SDR family oxidoreductase [Deltaproteobacteria bacterium]